MHFSFCGPCGTDNISYQNVLRPVRRRGGGGGSRGFGRTPFLAWYTNYHVIDSRSTTGLVQRTMARDPRLLAYNKRFARHRVLLRFGGLTLCMALNLGTAGFIDRRQPAPAPRSLA